MKYKVVDDHLRDIVEPELLAGERLLWSGQPRPMRMARRNIASVLFGFFWTGILLFMFNQFSAVSGEIARSGEGGFLGAFSLILLVFFLIGAGMILSPLWRYLEATRTYYAVTDRRALMISRWFPGSVRSYAARDMDRIERRGSDQGGDVIFAHELRVRARRRSSFGRGSNTYTVDIGFFGIPNTREVEALMLETFRPDEYEDEFK